MAWTRETDGCSCRKRVARRLYVNLGIGIRRWSRTTFPDGIDVSLQSENGDARHGPFPYEDEVDADLINAGKQTSANA